MDISWGRKKSLVKDMNARDGMEQAISQRLQRRAWKQGWHGKGAGGRWGPRAEADFPAESENSMFCVSQALGWEQIPLPSSPPVRQTFLWVGSVGWITGTDNGDRKVPGSQVGGWEPKPGLMCTREHVGSAPGQLWGRGDRPEGLKGEPR